MTRAGVGLVVLTVLTLAGCGSVVGDPGPSATAPTSSATGDPTGGPVTTEGPPTRPPPTGRPTEDPYVKVAGAPIGNADVDNGRDGEHCVGVSMLVDDFPSALTFTDLQVVVEDAEPFAEGGSACSGHATCEGKFRWTAANAKEPCWFPVREVGTSDSNRLTVRVNGRAYCPVAEIAACNAFEEKASRKLDIDNITLTAPSPSPTAEPPSTVPDDTPQPTN